MSNNFFYATLLTCFCVTAFAAEQNRVHIASSLGEAGEAAVNAGFKGVFTCSGIFVAGRTLEQVLQHELQGVPEEPVPIVNYDGKYVSVPFSDLFPAKIHAYRKGMGCTTLPIGSTTADIVNLPYVEQPQAPGNPEEILWPMGDKLPDIDVPAEVDVEQVKAIVQRAFDGETYGNENKTIALVIVYKGQIIGEAYAHGFGIHTQYRTWSAAKSIASALIGILTGQGKLDVKAPAPIPEWQGEADPRKLITVENLLEMSSGLETGGSNSDGIYWLGRAVTQDATAAPLEVSPGSRWKYSNNDTLLLMRAARHVIGNDFAYLTFPRRELFNKIGMRDTYPEIDHDGNFIFSSQVFTTARDLARFALLFSRDGVWLGERILPEGWVDYSVQPAAAKKVPGRGYAKQWWLLDSKPGVPEGTYTAAGARGQYATVVPGHDLVIVRRGIDPFTVRFDQEQLVVDIAHAVGVE